MRRLVGLGLLLAVTGCATPYLENKLSAGCAQVLAKPEPASMKTNYLDWHKLSEAEWDARQEYARCQRQQDWVTRVPRIYPSGDLGPAPSPRYGPVTCISISPGMVTCH